MYWIFFGPYLNFHVSALSLHFSQVKVNTLQVSSVFPNTLQSKWLCSPSKALAQGDKLVLL